MNQFTIIAKTLKNLEDVLASEIEALGGTEIEIGRRMVSFRGDKRLLYLANLRLRTALRVLKPIHTFRASTPDELYEDLSRFEWDRVMTPRQSFSVDTVVYSESFTHSKYVGYRTKDAIVDYFRERSGTRPTVRLDNPDIYIHIHISHDEVTLALDSSGESLHKRGYRVVQTDAPINEVLAAGILLKAGWQGETDLIDPMCGSGTFLIEAALIARGIAPGIFRQSFAFEQWLDFDQALFDEVYNDDSAEREFVHRIYGSDILPNAIKVAEQNVSRSGMARHITLEVMPLESRPQPEVPALVVCNPPYGERLKLQAPDVLYAMIGERLKHNFPGCIAWIIAYRPEHFDSIGLRQSARYELMNGSLDCELRSYELFSGKREDYKRAPRAERRPTASERPRKPARRDGEQPSRPSRSARPDSRDQRPRSTKGRPMEGKGRPTPRGFAGEGMSERSSRPREARQDTQSRSERGGTSRTKTRSERKTGLWPSDRFNYIDREGKVRRRPPRTTNVQVFRDED